MDKKLLALILPVMAVVFIVGLFLIKFMWSWVIPDLFPGAVLQGLVVKNISWLTAVKLALFVSFFAGIANSGVRCKG